MTSTVFCPLCVTNEIEDEYHFLLICPFHIDLRVQPYFQLFQHQFVHAFREINQFYTISDYFTFYQKRKMVTAPMSTRNIRLCLLRTNGAL